MAILWQTETEETEETREGFRVTDDKAAEWALRKILDARAERDRLNTLASDDIARLQAMIDANTKKCDEECAYFESLLREYVGTVQMKETKTQASYQLLSGKLVLKKAKQNIKRVDDAALLAWTEKNKPDLVKHTAAVNWAELKKGLEIVDGAIVDDAGCVLDGVGLEVEFVPETFEVK